MKLHRGRLIDHVHIRATDFPASARFYRALLDVVGIEAQVTDDHLAADELWIDHGEQGSRIHLAFQAVDREMVDAGHKAGLAAGGRDNGAPGERDYHPGYYAAFLLDPDGNNIEFVYHGPFRKSADSVEISAPDPD
ncbi:VOC family protein [Sphingobium nicotianae]|uniref:VOC family protein n=1 Tax=Sphingobium nicotianae TaxID=2782607 RepID=A0A9X1IQZ7_9SPHN|nr:VOC family protein [Sphingobium nicotianae]MBT2187006.1 VOC family protein [Sphingobium nicotianae]